MSGATGATGYWCTDEAKDRAAFQNRQLTNAVKLVRSLLQNAIS